MKKVDKSIGTTDQDKVRPHGWKSQVVRDFIGKYPNYSASQLQEVIKHEQSIHIHKTTISSVLGAVRQGRTITSRTDLPDGLADALALVKIVNKIGGFDKTRKLLNTIDLFQLSQKE